MMRRSMLFLFLFFGVKGMAQTRDLAYFVDKAIESSPLLADLRNQVENSRLDSLLILAALRPQVSFSSTDYYAPVVNGYGYDKAITNGANLSGLVTVNKSLLNARTNRLQFEGIRLLVEAAKNNLLITKQDLQKSVINQYLVTYGDQLVLNFNSILQHKMNQEEATLKKLTQQNVYRQVDYLSFYVTVKQNEFKLKQDSIQYHNDYATLDYLCGIYDTGYLPLDSPRIELSPLPVVTNSVFFKKYQIDSLSILNNKNSLNKNYYPRLNVYADAGYNSSLAYLPYKNFGTSVGLSLMIPIYDGKQKKLQLEKFSLLENTRRRNRDFYMNQYKQQVAQINNQLQSLKELTSDINQQLKYIETLITVNEQLLQVGEVKIYDYILAINNFLNAKTILTDNMVKQWLLINQLNY